MLRINLNDNGQHLRFAPLSLTRPLGALRMGIFTNEERWKVLIPSSAIGFTTENYLQKRFIKISEAIEVNACVIPTPKLAKELLELGDDTILMQDNTWIATKELVKEKDI